MTGMLDHDVLAEVLSLAGTENPDFFSQLVGIYQTSGLETLGAMRQAELSGDGHQLARLAHKLKGMSVNLGAKVVADHCARLEAGDLDVPVIELQKVWELTVTELLKVSNHR